MGSFPTPEEKRLPMKDINEVESIPTEFFAADKWPKC